MTTSITVDKKSVEDLLKSGASSRFIIPEYQRPYAWTDDEVLTLFNDLKDFTLRTSDSGDDGEQTYFLGSIVSFENDNGEREIIDGQQRLSTLYLLLRAIYSKLETMHESEEVKFKKSQIEPTIWKRNSRNGKIDYETSLISSEVMGEPGNVTFSQLLKTGIVDNDAKDAYSRNYLTLTDEINKFARDEPEQFIDFITNVLERAIILPISAEDQDTALTIFSTLNDRGLPLTDADIFKAKIYSNLSDKPEKQARFIDKWRNLTDDALSVDESIQSLFYYYMFYLRALDGDRNTTTPGVRKYYGGSRSDFARLLDKKLLKRLDHILDLWRVTNAREKIEGQGWSENHAILSSLDILTSYPNEFWKYPVITYYLKWHNDANFEAKFEVFLKRLAATLAAEYIIQPTISAVKGGILNLNSEIINSKNPDFKFREITTAEIKPQLVQPNRRIVRLLLKMLAYDNPDQTTLLPGGWEIEHILPTKWDDHYFPPEIPSGKVKEMVEHIGNKIPLEKKLNIKASNNFFSKKREEYRESSIAEPQSIAGNSDNWGIPEIEDRDAVSIARLLTLLREWGAPISN